MTALSWVFVAFVMVVCFLLGWSSCGRWSHPQHRANVVLAVVFAIVGLIAVGDVFYLHNQFQRQVSCNTRLIAVLKDRSDARDQVDKSTQAAQAAAVLAFDAISRGDYIDSHVREAHDAFAEASQDRAKLAAILAEPYPDC